MALPGSTRPMQSQGKLHMSPAAMLRQVPAFVPMTATLRFVVQVAESERYGVSHGIGMPTSCCAAKLLTSAVLAVTVPLRRQRRPRCRGYLHDAGATAMAAGSQVDTSMDIAMRPEKKLVKELSRYEDPDYPVRPPALPRPRMGLWAPPGPEPIEPPEMLVVGLGRRLRASPAHGPRTRLGAGAVEALQRRYAIRTFFDADLRSYIATCRSSLDKTGCAGMQRMNFLQPLADRDGDIGSAIYSMMQKPNMDKAMLLFVLSDRRLPFGQLRMRSAFDGNNPQLQSAFGAVGPDNRVTCLHIGVGHGGAGEALLAAEASVLPRVLGNAATAIEIWLSEADLGLVMRFVNRPELYEMPPGWPYRNTLPDAAPGAALPPAAEVAGRIAGAGVRDSAEEGDGDADGGAAGIDALESHNLGSLVAPAEGDSFALFDLNRNDPTELPRVELTPMSPQVAMTALGERPPGCQAIRVAGRRFKSLARLQSDLVEMMLEHQPGNHLRFGDDEEAIKALISFHPDSDRLLEDLVAVKVDCSPIDDDTRCLWVIKFDGYEEDVSLRACLSGLQHWLQLQPEREPVAGHLTSRDRLGLGRWTRGLRETTFERAKAEERNPETRTSDVSGG
eukprot:CAMPEP_0179044834 /NCGR_PEP_ID=MMETSP0796-20121207/17872_1 /TAXON_ID=73915 /ORGANISM="Pyrodinium bahamense, Strain pbaha01" /LENGTH=616 /DNA_ID=CAMNT_0020741233 /DNA_START=48 /DNA_END=1895 /DNA_ORIENTATION=+